MLRTALPGGRVAVWDVEYRHWLWKCTRAIRKVPGRSSAAQCGHQEPRGFPSLRSAFPATSSAFGGFPPLGGDDP